MVIVRNGKVIKLSNKEMQQAYFEIEHDKLLQEANDELLYALRSCDDFNPEEDCEDMYGFTVEEACNPDSEKYQLEEIVYRYQQANDEYDTKLYRSKMQAVVDEYLVEIFESNISPEEQDFEDFLREIISQFVNKKRGFML